MCYNVLQCIYKGKELLLLPKIHKTFRLDNDVVDKIEPLKKLLQHGQLVPKKLSDTDIIEFAINKVYEDFKREGYDL